ncbi:MAG: hypothetical protein G01um101413_971 [Parcubacteria group bacterium Gr01-1014_13]|nr:MAG: hypothetical protein G01um101413_971 [Parcubacteria group bacterium Gr01-1014_13]
MKKPIKNNLIIELHVPDFGMAKEFYLKLGFKISMDERPDNEGPGYMTVTREDEFGNTLINFYGGDERVYNQSYFKQFPRNTKRGYAVELTIPTSDVEAIYNIAARELPSHITRGLKELKDHQYKWKDFRMVDPFGFYLRFTELLDWGQK